jgi:hypothetical protein
VDMVAVKGRLMRGYETGILFFNLTVVYCGVILYSKLNCPICLV